MHRADGTQTVNFDDASTQYDDTSWYYAQFEIIGYPVADGSAGVGCVDDAGRYGCKEAFLPYVVKQNGSVAHVTSCGICSTSCHESVEDWLNVWGKTLVFGLANLLPSPCWLRLKVGDLCQRRDGKYVQVDSYSNDRPCPVMCKSDIGGQDCFTLDGRNHNAVNNDKDIISPSPSHPKAALSGRGRWLKLGIETRCYEGKIRVSKSGLIEVCYNGMAYAMPLTQSAENRQYVINKMRECSPDGWQLYEPAEPETKPCDKCNGTGILYVTRPCI